MRQMKTKTLFALALVGVALPAMLPNAQALGAGTPYAIQAGGSYVLNVLPADAASLRVSSPAPEFEAIGATGSVHITQQEFLDNGIGGLWKVTLTCDAGFACTGIVVDASL